MMRTNLRIGPMLLLAAAIAGAPGWLLAQGTNQAPAAKPAAGGKAEAAPKKKSPHPFRGKLAAVDLAAKTIQLGKSTYYITPATKITRDGQPARLEEGVVGEQVTGYAEPTEDDKMAARTVYFGGKTGSSGGDKTKKKKGGSG